MTKCACASGTLSLLSLRYSLNRGSGEGLERISSVPPAGLVGWLDGSSHRRYPPSAATATALQGIHINGMAVQMAVAATS